MQRSTFSNSSHHSTLVLGSLPASHQQADRSWKKGQTLGTLLPHYLTPVLRSRNVLYILRFQQELLDTQRFFNQLTYLLDRMYNFSSSCIRQDVEVSCNVKWLKKIHPRALQVALPRCKPCLTS